MIRRETLDGAVGSVQLDVNWLCSNVYMIGFVSCNVCCMSGKGFYCKPTHLLVFNSCQISASQSPSNEHMLERICRAICLALGRSLDARFDSKFDRKIVINSASPFPRIFASAMYNG